MNSQASLFSPSDETTRHRGSLLAREASVSSSPVKNMECGVGSPSKRPSAAEDMLSETNADAIEKLVSLVACQQTVHIHLTHNTPPARHASLHPAHHCLKYHLVVL
jgi:hypothetical protein